MKKLFMFLAVAGLATFGASCGGSDDSPVEPGPGPGPEPTEKQLVLSANKTDIAVGDAVTFTVQVEGKAEAGVELYEGTTKITSPHTFTKAGEFQITAKKSGFKTSAAVTIKVTEKSTESKQLTLVANPTSVTVGQTVAFIVKEGSDIISDAVITQVGGAVVSNGVWTASATGTFKFKATKAGALDSAEVSVVVTEAPASYDYFIAIDGVQYELSFGIYGVDMYEDGKDGNGNAKYTKAAYTLTNGKVAYRYTFQMYKGSNSGADYNNAWEVGGVIQGVQFFIEAKTADSSPLDTPVSEWMWSNAYTIVDGADQYQGPDGTSTISFGFTPPASSTANAIVSFDSSGGYESPVASYELVYSGQIEGLYRFNVTKPASKSAVSLKSKTNAKPAKAVKM